MRSERNVLDHPIWAEIKKLDDGWDIGIYGGCSTHVGAVSLADPSGTGKTLERPHHKDSFVSEKWARELAKTWQAPVCVRCGIHYDNATKQQLAQITASCDEMLQEIKAQCGSNAACGSYEAYCENNRIIGTQP